MITESQEAAVVQARQGSRQFKQDRKHPFLINTKDGRLFPNVAVLRDDVKVGKDYVVFTGDPKASKDERMRWLDTRGGRGPSKIVDSGDPEPPFDIGKATVDEMVAFAASEYQATLDPKKHHNALRAELRKLAQAHGTLTGDLT